MPLRASCSLSFLKTLQRPRCTPELSLEARGRFAEEDWNTTAVIESFMSNYSFITLEI